jgi:hypothetical protein
MKTMLRILLPIACPLVILSLAACGNTAILDQSPTRNYVVVGIENDSASSIDVTLCYAQRCSVHDLTDSISPDAHRDEAVNNAQGGIAIFRVTSRETVRCLRVRYASGQEQHTTVKASWARPCPWSS